LARELLRASPAAASALRGELLRADPVRHVL
jgi:hypothetical protein